MVLAGTCPAKRPRRASTAGVGSRPLRNSISTQVSSGNTASLNAESFAEGRDVPSLAILKDSPESMFVAMAGDNTFGFVISAKGNTGLTSTEGSFSHLNSTSKHFWIFLLNFLKPIVTPTHKWKLPRM